MASPWGKRNRGSKTGGQKGGRKRKDEFTCAPKQTPAKDKGCSYGEKLKEMMRRLGFEDWYPDFSMFRLPPCRPEYACNEDCPIYVELVKQVKEARSG